jgi:DNA-binding NarL/FixJ family response regulator
MNSLNLAIVEDDPEVRRLLGGYLGQQPGLNVVLVCESAEQFLAGLPDALPPAVVLFAWACRARPRTKPRCWRRTRARSRSRSPTW